MVLPAKLSEIIHFKFARDCEADSKGVMQNLVFQLGGCLLFFHEVKSLMLLIPSKKFNTLRSYVATLTSTHGTLRQ